MNQLKSKLAGAAMLLAGALSMSAQGSGSDVVITGSVIFPDNALGIWEFPTSGYTPKVLARTIKANAGGLAANDGYYYCNQYESVAGIDVVMTKNYNMSTWEESDSYNSDLSSVATTMAYSPWRDAAYGCFFNSDQTGYVFVKWNYSSFRKDLEICALERPWNACAFDSKSDLYAIEENGDLYRVDVSDGTMTKIGSTGIQSTYTCDGAIDPATDTFYWCVANDTENALYKVDLTTAKATKLYDLLAGEQIAGMYIAEPEAPKDAPAKTSVSINLSSSSTALAVPVRFNMPRYTVAQAAIPDGEEMDWIIYANGKQMATGKAAKGESVTETVTLDKADYYCFTVVTKNAAGTSPKAQSKRFFGVDSPKAPTSSTMSVSGNAVTVQWNSVPSTGVHGGAVAYSNATFTVTRQPDNKVIATGLTNSNRKVVDEIEMPAVRTDYYYEIQAEVDGVKAPLLTTSTVSFGPLKPAFELTFPASVAQAGWTMIDNNADGSKWSYYSSYKSIYVSGYRGFDDYAVTPPVDVEAGFSYPLSISLRTSSYYDEEFEVLYGTSPEVSAMTKVAIEPTKYKGTTFQTFTGTVRAEATGKLYIAIHAKTADTSNAIYVEKIALGEGSNVMAPKPISDLQFTLPRDGSVAATLTFKAPETTIEGQALTGEYALNKMLILRDGKSVFNEAGEIAAGKVYDWTDNGADLTIGEHTYTITAYNAFGAGETVEQTVYVGPNKPSVPTMAKFTEDGNTGKVTITWAPVTTDEDGNEFVPGMVTYRIIDREMNTVAEGVTETSYTYQAVPEGEQKFVQFGVYAVTAGGESADKAATAYQCAGQPSVAPWRESFANRQISSPFGYNYISGTEPWYIVSTTEQNYLPQDGDGGFMYFEAYSGDLTALVTGKIDLSEIVSPALTYFTYNYGSDDSKYTNTITVQVDNGDGNGFRDVQTDVVSESGPHGKWNKIVVSLDEYALQTVALRFMPGNVSGAFFTLDNLRVDSYLEYNLAARDLTVPQVVDPGKEFEISFTAVNNGQKTVGNYSMQLWRNDEMVESLDFNGLAPDAVKTAVFSQTLDVVNGDGADYYGVVSTRIDENEKDNQSETLYVSVAHPVVPVPTALEGSQQGSNLVLAWAAPDLATAAPAQHTESFEACESWSQNILGWKNIDADQTTIGGINSVLFPMSGLCGWYVTDTDHAFVTENTASERWNSHSGKKHLASSYVMRSGNSVQSDDWAISPLLYGGAQDVSLWVKSFDGEYLEDIELLYSSRTTSTDDFVSLGMVYELPNAWAKLRVMLPDGAKYFAIRSRSVNKHQLFVDDVTFIPADGEAAQLEIKGYNVYRDGVKLNSTPVAAPTYTDEEFPTGGTPDYFVTAVYANGESRASNHLTLVYDGIAAVGADGSVAVRVEGSDIVVTGATSDVTVYSVDGRAVNAAAAAPEVRLSSQAGVYIVRTATHTAKVVVK